MGQTTLPGECSQVTEAPIANSRLVFEMEGSDDEIAREKRATEFIFFADKTWFCIKALLLSHVSQP